MEALKIIVNVFHILIAVTIIVVILLQNAKSAGLSGLVSGGAETFFGKNKGRSLDGILSKGTTIAAISFLVTSIILQLVITKLGQ